MRVERLKKYCIAPESGDTENEGGDKRHLWIWGRGARLYCDKLIAAFPEVDFVIHRSVKSQRYDWCMGIAGEAEAEIRNIERCLQLFHRTLYVDIPLDECFALGWHSKPGSEGKPALTALGQWVHMSKSYGLEPESRGDAQIAELIAEQMGEFISRHPLYKACTGIVGVLPSNPTKAFDLPGLLAELLEADCGIPFLRGALHKVRITAQMKFCLTLEEKIDNIAGSISAERDMVAGRKLLIIDDILESGTTITETCQALRRSGAANLYGLVATKTLKSRFL